MGFEFDPMVRLRPQHPDMTLLIDLVLQLDGQATEGGADADKIVGEVVDVESLLYLASQRLLRAGRVARAAPFGGPQRVAVLALYMEAVVLGYRLHQRRER